MSKPVKRMLTDYLKNRYGGLESACVVDLTGLDVISTEKLRGALRERNARLEVIKNRLARQAFADTALRPLGDILRGPCALITSEDSIIDAAKGLVNFAKEYKQLELKEAILDGDPDLLSVVELSKMKSRGELCGEIAALIEGPGRRIAGALALPSAKIAGCLKALAEKE